MPTTIAVEQRRPDLISHIDILETLDEGARAFVFPMLDNGYVYLAASRLSLLRSDRDWAMIFEIFGYSPRSGFPDLNVTSFGSALVSSKSVSDFASEAAYLDFIAQNRKWQQNFFHPIDDEGWIDANDAEAVDPAATHLRLRGNPVPLPGEEARRDAGWISGPLDIAVLSRALASEHRDAVLARNEERRVHLATEMAPLLTLNDWMHPDIVDPDCIPSESETFRQLALVLETGDPGHYRLTGGNTHWSNWPDGGAL